MEEAKEKLGGAKESTVPPLFPLKVGNRREPRSLVPTPGQRDDLCFPPLLFSPFPLFLAPPLSPPLFTSHLFLPFFLSPSPFFLFSLFLFSIWEGRRRLNVACLNVNDGGGGGGGGGGGSLVFIGEKIRQPW